MLKSTSEETFSPIPPLHHYLSKNAIKIKCNKSTHDFFPMLGAVLVDEYNCGSEHCTRAGERGRREMRETIKRVCIHSSHTAKFTTATDWCCISMAVFSSKKKDALQVCLHNFSFGVFFFFCKNQCRVD